MKRLIEKKPLWKWLMGFVLIIMFGNLFLFPFVWSGVNSYIVLPELAADSVFQSEVAEITGEQPGKKDSEFWKNLSDKKKEAVKAVVRERFKKVNWLPVHLMVNAITFSILGLLAGFFLRDFILSGIIPLSLILSTLSVLKSPDFTVGSTAVTIAAGLSAQIITVYLFSFLGFIARKRLMPGKPPEAGEQGH